MPPPGGRVRLASRVGGIEIRQGYGLTEASPIATGNSLGAENRFGSVGPAMPWNEITIADESGDTLAPGSEGEILVKGTTVMAGYYNNRAGTDRALRGGWLHTGDLGSMDAEGYLYISGRKKDMIIKNGLNIYPKEVERILLKHPDIGGASVRSNNTATDDVVTEALHAEVYTIGGRSLETKSLISWCVENLSSYKLPDTFDIRQG